MSSYYYIMTSLPTLSFKDKNSVPFTRESYLETIKGFISKRDYECIEDLLDSKPIKRSFASKYQALESSIERAILHYRAKRLGINNKKYNDIADIDSEILTLAEKAVESTNPLEAEVDIFGIYWKALDELSLFHFADFLSLCVYTIKLKLLFRKTTFNKENGQKEAERLFQSYNEVEDFLNA